MALISINKDSSTPIYIQISNAITEQIRKGSMVSGAKLPGTRVLAKSLGVHRKTVVAAYDELLAQGWLESHGARGTFVSHKLPVVRPVALNKDNSTPQREVNKAGFPFTKNPNLALLVIKGSNQLAFNDGFPDVRLAPFEALSRAYRSVLRHGYRKNLLFYADLFGEMSLRQAMVDYLRETRGLPIGVENVMITRGSTMAIFLTAQSVITSGEVMVVGEISYNSANLIFKNAGAKLVTVPVDEWGLDVDAMEDICKKQRVRMVYVTPHHHYPTTVTMPAERRLRLLQLAQTYNFCILEDDYDFDFHYDCNPIIPLAGADTGGHVIYVGSLCKAISPALRVGFAVGPSEVIEGMGQMRRILDRQGDNMLEAAVAMLFRDGDLKRHLKKAQKTYHHRRDVFCDMLDSQLSNAVEFTKPTGGMAVWAKFDQRLPLPDLSKRAKKKGLYISDGQGYAPGMNATRLGFASLTEEEMERGMGILRSVL